MEHTNFISNFVHWNEGNECPKDYLVWSAYGLLGLAIGRRVHIDMKQFFVYGNPFILLVGPTGNRKTFARDQAEDLILEALPDTIISAECETHQGILRYMEAPEQMRTFIDENTKRVEFRPYGLFAPELMDYVALNPIGMVNFLTNIYDRKAYRYRLKGEDRLLVNPYFVMLACTTDAWLTKQMNAETFSQGYGRRTIVVCGGDFVPMRNFYRPEHEASKQRCIEWLKGLYNVIGPMIITPEADAFFFEGWYLKQVRPDDKFLANWRASKNINVLKVAMLSSLAERRDRVITVDHMKLAVGLLDDVESKMSMITNQMGRSEVVGPAAELLRIIANHGGAIPDKDLRMLTLKDFRDPIEQFRVLQFLQSTGQITISDQPINGVKRKYVFLNGKETK